MSTVTAEFSVSSEAFVLGQALEGCEFVEVSLTQLVPVERTLVPYFWVEVADPDEFEAGVRSDERVDSLTKLDSGSGRNLYRIDWATEIDGLLDALQDHDLIVEGATGTTQSWQFRVRGPDHGTLSSFQRACNDHDVPIRVHRVRTADERGTDRYRMSDKQREAVELAYANGYFSVPRETTLEELGEMVGISGQSFGRRLARGLTNLVAETLMADEDS